MEPAAYAADGLFRSFLHGCGRDAPMLVDVRAAHLDQRCEYWFTAQLSDGRELRWAVSDEYVFRCQSVASLLADLRSLYSRRYEDHLLALELRPLQEAALQLVRNSPPDDPHVGAHLREMYQIEDHIRRNHRERSHLSPIVVGIDRGTGRSLTTHTFTSARRADPEGPARPVVERILEACDADRFRQLEDIFALQAQVRQDMLAAFILPGADIGSKAAQKKGQKLLKEWLSPEQLRQYEEKNYFDVVGSDTGKCYRIRHGRQMNIEELDSAGERVCGWCFLPEGGLVAGDIMLAQKIALENFETEALRKANRFGGPFTVSPDILMQRGQRRAAQPTPQPGLSLVGPGDPVQAAPRHPRSTHTRKRSPTRSTREYSE